jgi:hypothetical protein
MQPMQRSHPLSGIGAGLFDRGYGWALALLRALNVVWNARGPRRLLRIGWQALRAAALLVLLVCAARGAGWI